MGDDWQPGDLALCVKTTGHGTIKAGAVATVERAAFCEDDGLFGLWFVGIVSSGYSGGFDARNFRKIRPHTPDAEDAETIALLTGKPAQVPA